VRIGLPLDGWALAVVDGAGAPVAMGESGELVIGGVGLARYLDTERDAAKFAPLPSLGWERAYRSGDVVRADEAGLLFLGRADEQVKLGGRRIELGEVDAALLALPGVRGAAAAVRRTRAGNQVLVGYVVPERELDTDTAALALREQLPADIAQRIKSGLSIRAEDYTRWQKLLFKRGWGAPTWPKQFGGTGWTPVQLHIFDEESAAAGAPRTLPFGLKMVGPVIMAFGNQTQQQRWLPRIVSGEDWWCQGYSEPGAGSDLASLKTRAERQGDHYIVNGQKTWNTLGQYADWIFCLVRTSNEASARRASRSC